MAYETGGVDKLLSGSKNPGAPTGLNQTAGQGYEASQGRYSTSGVDNLLAQSGQGYVDQAQSWYSGANLDGTTSGWDTTFMSKAFDQQREAQDLAMSDQDPTKVFDWYKRDDATGVVAWNDPEDDLWVGDVFENGKKVGNVYDDFGRRGGDLMMSEFVLDSRTKQKIFDDPTRQGDLHAEVKAATQENTRLRKSASDQVAFDEAVTERQDKLQKGWGDEALQGGGALGGAALGAGAGAFAGPVGMAVGGLIGGAVGYFGANRNQDLLTEQWARAQEVTALANKKYGDGAALTTGMKEYSAVGLRMINPVSNIVQGLYDASGGGKVGDGESEFYAYDENAERKRPAWVAVADVAAVLSDSLLQFTNPVGIGLYLGATGGHVAGSAGTIAQTGAGWDDRTASFNEYEGGKEWSAAIGNVGIDVVQMGFAGALAKAGAAGRAAFTVGAQPTRFQRATDKLLPWREAREGVSSRTINGMKFTVDDATNTAIAARPAMTLLAPSEAIRWVPTTWLARNRAALSEGAIGPDDFYKAALELGGRSRFSNAVINGWAEGAEEAVQAVLEPVSFSADVDPGQVFESYFYGMAAGAGMSLGRVSAPPSDEQQQKFRAQVLYQMRNSTGELPAKQWDEVWKAMGADQRKRMSMPDAEEQAAVAGAIKTLQERTVIDRARTSPIGVAALNDLMASAYARDLGHVNPNADNVLQLSGFSGDKVIGPNGESDGDLFVPNAGVTSAWQAVHNVAGINKGIRVQAEELVRDVEAKTKELAAATEPEDQARVQAELDQLNARVTETNGLIQVSDAVMTQLNDLFNDYREAVDVDVAEGAIDAINGFLSSAFFGRMTDEQGQLLDDRIQELARRSVEMKFARHPIIGKDSFVILMPQVSKALSRANAHGQLQTHQAGLKALGADRDGDTMISQNFIHLPQAQLDALRAGTQYIGSVVSEGREGYELVTDLPDGEALFISLFKEAYDSTDTALRGNAVDSIVRLQAELYDRYTGTVDETVLVEALDTFRLDVLGGNVNARMNLATTLFNSAPQELGFEFGRRDGVPEMMWLWQRISLEWDRHQRAYAANAPELEMTPAAMDAPLPAEQAYLRSRAIEDSASDGQAMAMAFRGDSPVRIAQKAHYSVFRAATVLNRGDYTTEQQNDFIEQFAKLGSSMGESELSRVHGRNRIQKRVAYWLTDIAKGFAEQGTDVPLIVLANTQVQDVRNVGLDQYEMAEGDVSLLQLLLRRSVDIEEAQFRETISQDEELQQKVKRLRRLSLRDVEEADRSTTAQLALFEVFGSHQLFDLIGEDSKYLGPQLTMSQLADSIADRTEESRNAQTYRWKRKAPYVLHVNAGFPPYTEAQATSGLVGSYKVVVDSIIAVAQTSPRRRRDRDELSQKYFKTGIVNLQKMLQSYRTINKARHSDTKDPVLLEAMLEENPGQLASVIGAIIPEAARLGAFEFVDGRVFAEPWVIEMLTSDPDRALLLYRVQTWLDEWSQMSEKDREFGQIKSRFLQTLSQLAHQPDGIELNRLLLALTTAPSLPELMETINNEPMWRGDRAALLAFDDDVAAFEADPSQVWNANLPGTLQREALQAFAQRTTMMSTAMVEYAQTLETERTLLTAVSDYAATKIPRDDGDKYHKLIELAIKNRINFTDHAGPRMRDAALAKVQSGILKLQDKGKADPAIAPLGEILVTSDEFGVKQSVMQTIDALTKYDPEDILSNPTLLAQGPVLVGLRDGSEIEVDLSTVEGAVAALRNESTNAFAKAVLFPTARDVNTFGTVQSYMDVSGLGLKTMLEEQDFSDLFRPLDERLTPAQALKYISMLEAGVRRAAIGKSEKEQANAYFPIQQMLNEFVVAYSHRVGANTRDPEQMRTELYVEVATALQATAALSAQDPSGTVLLDQVREILSAKLRERVLRDSSAVQAVTDDVVTRVAEDVLVLDAYSQSYLSRAEVLQDRLTDPSLTPEERAVAEAQFERLNQVVNSRITQLQTLGAQDNVRAALSMFLLTGDKAADLERKGQIRNLLKAANRIGRFQGNYMLIDKVNSMLAYDSTAALDETKISFEEWQELGSYAATVYLAELAGHAGSSVNLTPLVLGIEGEAMRRYFDASWSYLLDGFFNPQVLEVARNMATQAKYNVTVNPATLANIFEGGLFNDNKLGRWTEMIVYSSLQARQALAAAPVGLAIPTGGVLPVTQGAYAGAGRLQFDWPPAAALTTRTKEIDPTADRVDWTAEEFVKLNNHFAGRVVLEGPDGEIDLLAKAGQSWVGEEGVADSPYKVISIQRLDEVITEALLDNSITGPVNLTIDYFDVDTQPHDRAWANNVFYTGVGRDRALSTAPSSASEMVFSTGGVSKKAQQNPLDTATKKGTGYKATPVTDRATTVSIESSAGSVAELLRNKVLFMLNKEHDIGTLQPGDSTTLYKLMKQRHVVVGQNAEGEVEAWWSERALAWESENSKTIQDPDFPLSGAKVVALSDRQAQTLLGEPGDMGVAGVVNVPGVNLEDMDIFPSLSAERLAEVGITRLGQTTTLDRTPFATSGRVLARLQWTGDKDAARLSRYEEAIVRFRERQVIVRAARAKETSFPITKINERNSNKLKRMLGSEALAPLFARLNIPFLGLRDMSEQKLTAHLQSKLEELARVNPSTVIWNHVHGANLDISQGVLSEVVTDNDFEKLGSHSRPTFEDIVIVDLDSYVQTTGGNMTLAYDLAKKAIRHYTKQGVTLVLASNQGATTLRTDLARHLKQGAEGYDQMAESAHFFAPINAASGANQTRRALESSLVSVQQITAQSIGLNFSSDRFGDASSENATLKEYWEGRPTPRTDSLNLVPTQLAHIYGKPVEGTGMLDQLSRVKERTIELLESPEGRALLMKQSEGDPDGVPIYQRTVRADGTVLEEPGIRSMEDAMDHLLGQLKANRHPLSVGEELMTGDLLPLLGTDGTILFIRFGFVAPNVLQLAEQTKMAVESTDTEMPARVAVSPAELAETWTTRSPATIMSIDPDHLAGASMIVRYTPNWLGKTTTEADGFKSSASPMPNDLAGPVENISDVNGIRINTYMGRKSLESKQAITGQVNNFRWAFALSGISFRRDMVEYLLGKKERTEAQLAQDLADVDTFLNLVANLDTGLTASAITEMLDSNTFTAVFGAQLNELSNQAFGSSIVDLNSQDLFDRPTDPLARLGQVLLATLMAPGVKVTDVIETSGILGLEDLNSKAQITLMPELFTDALNDFNYPELREMLFNRINARLPRRADGSMPYRLKKNWQFLVQMRNPVTGRDEGGPTSGVLQLSLELPADENPTTYTQAGIRTTRRAVSPHVAMTTWETIGGRTAMEREPDRDRKVFSRKGIEDFSNEQDGGYWQMLRAVPAEDKSYKPWSKLMPAQRLHVREAGIKVHHYLQPLNEEAQKDERYRAAQSKLMELLNINDDRYRVEIDYLVRQFWGAPAASPEQDPTAGDLSPSAAYQAAELMLTNVRKNLLPTYGGVIPLPHETFLALLFRANEGHPKAWSPKTGPRRNAKLAKDWTEWVHASFGQVRESKELFSSMFRQDLDGFMHTYQAATDDMHDLPISMDELTNLRLMDKKTNLYLASLDPNEDTLLTDPVILETMKATLDAMAGHDPIVGMEDARTSSTSDLARRIETHTNWLRTKQLPRQQKTSLKHYVEEGAWYIESSRDTHNFFHNVINLSVGMRLLNPALWTSAVLEVFVRQSLEGGANLLQGQTKMQARVMGDTDRAETLKKFDQLAEAMGQDNRFLAVVYDELMYRNLVEAGSKKLGTALEKFARFSAKATSDPKFGMLAKAVAKRYIEAAWEYLDKTDNAISVDAFVAEMNRNPLFLANHFEPNSSDPNVPVPFNPHRAGLNRIAQVRSVKASVTSKLIMGGIDSLARNPKFRYNALGHMLKIPFLFTRFNANALTTMTGMGGFDQMAAMFLDQRQSPLIGRVKAAMSGREYNPEVHDTIDMTDVIEGVDLVRPFLKGAVTHTGLMALGMAAGGLGLSGEDEESKRRRRIAEYLGTPYYYDPRQAQNDFRFADAVFLDWLPGPLENMFLVAPGVGEGAEPRSAAVPHWIFRQFLSPVVGIERFFETGDVRQIKWGFADAFSVIPTTVTRLWKEASVTGDMLAEAARDEDAIGTPRNTSNATQFLINMVGVYERALLENSFVNTWRSGADTYDRDPWSLPMMRNGEIKRFNDPEQTPRPTDARTQFIDEETGEVREGYQQRSDWSARLHQFAENNFTAALILSLTTGQIDTDSTFLRKNMVVNTQDIELAPTSRAEAEALLISALDGQTKAPGGPMPKFSLEELEGILKAREQAAGRWWNQEEITAEAKKMLGDPRYSELTAGLTLLDKDGMEVLSKDGADGVFRGLRAGMVQLGDDSLRGVWIPRDMRVDISKDWIKELIQEGLDLGLNDYMAMSRARRIWYGGGFDEPDAVGLEDLIWSDKIPTNGKVVYNQLNTTFTMGPDGKPWATPFGRATMMQALGIPWPHKAVVSDQGGLGSDVRGNVTDSIVGINTGLHALERVEQSWQIEKPKGLFEEAAKGVVAPSKPFKSEGSGWKDFGSGWKDFGSGWKDFGGGGYSGGGSGYTVRMNNLPRSTSPYGNSMPFINTGNPIIRRAIVRRERVWSERGRLKQWQ